NQERTREREIAGLEATTTGWQERLRPTDGAARATSAAEQHGRAVSTRAENITVTSARSATVAAVLVTSAPSKMMAESDYAVLSAREGSDEGRARVIEAGSETKETAGWRLDAPLPAGQWLLDVIEPSHKVAAALNAMLVDVVAVADAAEARRVVAADTRLRAVTKAGSLFGPGWFAAGRGGATPAVELAAKIDQA